MTEFWFLVWLNVTAMIVAIAIVGFGLALADGWAVGGETRHSDQQCWFICEGE